MGNLSSMLLFLFFVAFSLQLGCQIFGPNSLQDPTQCNTPLQSILNGRDAIKAALAFLFSPGGAIILAGTLFFPNPYIIFAGITSLFLNFAILPESGFTVLGIPEPFNAFFVGIFNLFWIIGVFGLFKGDTP